MRRRRKGRFPYRDSDLPPSPVLADDLAGRRVDALAVHEARRRIRALRTPEEQDVRLWAARTHLRTRFKSQRSYGSARRTARRSTRVHEARVHEARAHDACGAVFALQRAMWAAVAAGAPVNGVVHPSAALLYAETAPLRLGEQAALWRVLRDVLRQDYVPARTPLAWSGRGSRLPHGPAGRKQQVVWLQFFVMSSATHRYSKSSS